MRTFLNIGLPAVLLLIAGVLLVLPWVDPAPPEKIRLATGSPDGAYHAYGVRLKEQLENQGIEVELVNTLGSRENLVLLDRQIDGVDIAFVQAGSIGEQKLDAFSLGSFFLEPVWLFHQPGLPLRHMSDLQGMRLAVGAEGSGTLPLVRQLLGMNGLDEENTDFEYVASAEAAQALDEGHLDAAFMVAGLESGSVKKLLGSPRVSVFDQQRIAAYTRTISFLHYATLPEGVVDFARNVPESDTRLLAAAANLVIREDFHPALVSLVLIAAKEIFSAGGVFQAEGEFPSEKYAILPLHADAGRFYQEGPPFLLKYLPFGLANMLDRLKVMLLPLLTILLPMMKLLPPVYRWSIRKKIYKWYSRLRQLDVDQMDALDSERIAELLVGLDRLEREIRQVDVPDSFGDEFYSLHQHLHLVRCRLESAQDSEAA